MQSAPIISFDYRPLPQLWRLGQALAVLAGLGPWLSAMPGWACLLADLVLLVAACRHARQRRRQDALRVVWLGDARWLLGPVAADALAWRLRRRWCWGSWIVLELAAAGRRRSLWLGPGNMSALSLRRLRARLALSPSGPAPEQHPLS